MTDPKTIAQFWQSFERNALLLAQARTADNVAYDEVLAKLQEIDEGLFFEFAVEHGNCELIITAEGDRSLFPLVEKVVSAAPAIQGWRCCALKPKLGFPESVEWEGYQICISEVVFEPLENGSGQLGLRLLVPGLTDEDAEHAHNALLRALDHGLGERQFADAVQYTEVAALDGPADEFIPLLDLESFIQWRSKQAGR